MNETKVTNILWAEGNPQTINDKVDYLQAIFNDLVYELDQRGGYDVLDDAENAANEFFDGIRDQLDQLKETIGNQMKTIIGNRDN